MAARCIAEFVGTFTLVFTMGCNVLGDHSAWGGASFGYVLMICIYAFASISNATFNPAVSATLGFDKSLGGAGMDWFFVSVYCVVQIVAGGHRGLCLLRSLRELLQIATGGRFRGTVPADVTDTMCAFMLGLVVFSGADTKGNTPNTFYGLAIGFVIITGAYGAGALLGGCSNPAIAIGIDTASIHFGFGWCLFCTPCG